MCACVHHYHRLKISNERARGREGKTLNQDIRRYKSGNSTTRWCTSALRQARVCSRCSVRNLYYYYSKAQNEREREEQKLEKLTESMQFVYYVSIYLFLSAFRSCPSYLPQPLYPSNDLRSSTLTARCGSCTNMCKVSACTIFRVFSVHSYNSYSVRACLPSPIPALF